MYSNFEPRKGEKDILIVRVINSISVQETFKPHLVDTEHAMMGFMVIVLKLGSYVQNFNNDKDS